MKNLVISILLIIICVIQGQSQNRSTSKDDSLNNSNWLEMIQDPNVNFYQAQAAFNNYWANRNDYKGNGYKIFKRWEYINESRVLPNGKLQAPDYVLNQYKSYSKNQNTLKSAAGNWTSYGSNTYPTNSTSQPTGMGRVNCIAFHPSNASTIFVGSPSGGIWKTTSPNGNSTVWTNLSSNLPSLGVSAILIHPTNPDIIYIGTGDRDGGDAPGIGVFKSIDGGSTWTQINSTMGNVTVAAMLMSPSDANTIIAATNGGIYKTTDGGTSWTLTASGNFKDIKFKPGDPSIVYAVKILTPAEFYRSSDTGDNWTQITSGVPSTGIGSRMVIGVSAANSSYVYLLQIKSSDNTYAGMLLSTDNGLNFSTQSTSPNILGYNCDGSGTASQASYDLCLTIDPTDENTIYVGGLNNWKSTDAGATWNIKSHWVGSNFSSSSSANCAASTHADQHWYEWSPLNGNLYLGNDGGISYTSDGGTTWIEITGNLKINQVYKLGQGPNNVNQLIFGLQDNGCTATTDGSSFYTVSGGDGMECVIDYDNSNYCYDTYVTGIIRQSTTGPTGSFSPIAGESTNGITESGAWVTPYLLHKTVPTTMFGGYKNVWRCTSVRSTVSWEAISSGETSNCIDIDQSLADVDIIYAVRSNSIKRTDNANTAAASVIWTACSLPGGYTPTAIETHPTDANIVYATANYYVYKSTDKGITWTNISGNLPALYINCLTIDKNANEGLYIGNQTGVWYKNASMTNWILFSNGLALVDVRELEIYYDATTPANNRIKAATYGRGIWQSDLAEINVINPTNFVAASISTSQIDLSWTKNIASNDIIIATSPTILFGYPTDGVSYSVGNSLPNGGGTVVYKGSAATYSHTSLNAGETYYYKIWSVDASNQYSAGLPYISEATYSHEWTGTTDNDWFNTSNWATGLIPTSTDNVYITSGGNQPEINSSGAICSNIKIETGASLTMSASTSYTLTVSGDWTNDGSFTAGIGIVDFNSTSSLQTIKGSSTSNFYILKITKSNIDNILEAVSPISLSATTTDARLQLVSGTFKLSNSNSNIIAINTNGTATNNAIGSGKRIWIDAGTFSVNSTWRINAGELKISGGIVNIGNANNQYLDYLNNAKITVEEGELNVSAAIFGNATSSTCIFNISGGTITVGTYYNGYARSSFEVSSQASFTMSGGTIVVRRAGTTGNGYDYQNHSSTSSITGGTLQIGNTLTPSGQTIRINSTVPVYNLVINSTNSPIAQLVTNDLTIKNDLTINSGSTLNSNDLNIDIGGNYTNLGTFTSGFGSVNFNGTALQTIKAGSSTFSDVIINNTLNNNADIAIDEPMTIEGLGTFTNGIIYFTNSGALTFGNSATVTSASKNSFVNGLVSKTGNTAFVLPTGDVITRDIGNGSQPHKIFAQFGFTPNASGTISALYHYDNSGLNSGSASNIDHPSTFENWDINSDVSLSNIILYWNDNSHPNGDICPHGLCSGDNIFNSTDLTLAYYDGTDWLDLFVNSENSSLAHDQGYIHALNQMTFSAKGSSKITLGSKNGNISLPIDLLNFTAICESNNIVINWQTASEVNSSHFILEKSSDLIEFEEIANVKAAKNSNTITNYSLEVDHPSSFPVYYRLKLVDMDGTITTYHYIDCNCNLDRKISIYPNPSSGKISIDGIYTIANLKIYNSLGKIVFNKIVFPNEDIQLNQFNDGIYLFTIEQNEGLFYGSLIIKK